ncbi:MAG: hypothetical protein ACKO7W_21245 [Elainella sp.]
MDEPKVESKLGQIAGLDVVGFDMGLDVEHSADPLTDPGSTPICNQQAANQQSTRRSSSTDFQQY